MNSTIALVAIAVFASGPPEAEEDLVQSGPEISFKNNCDFQNNFFLAQLRNGTADYEEYWKALSEELEKCKMSPEKIGLRPDEMKEIRKKGCATLAFREYRRNSGKDPVGERVYLKNLRAQLARCGFTRSEVELHSCRSAKDTRYRSDGYCEQLARVSK